MEIVPHCRRIDTRAGPGRSENGVGGGVTAEGINRAA